MKKIKQLVKHLTIDGNNGLNVLFKKTKAVIVSPPLPGFSNIQMWYSAPCGTDGSANGYYHGGRFEKDLKDKEKLAENIELTIKAGVLSTDKVIEKLLRIPNHEGWGNVVNSTPNPKDGKRSIAAFLPKISSDGKKIIGMYHQIIDVNFQNLQSGDWVVPNAALRCDKHWQINPQTGFPNQCHRSTANGHTRKRVPGHYEIYGFSHYAPQGLPYPNHMLNKVPQALKKWIEKKRNLRERLLIATEPLSCCFEAFHPIINAINSNKESVPSIILILGDGPNAALLTLVATSIFPKVKIFVTGKTPTKLKAIRNINPQKIITVNTREENKHVHGHIQIKKLLDGNKIDIIIPTFHVDTIRHYSDTVDKNGWVIVWSADQVQQMDYSVFKGVGNPKKIHLSYGGWNQAEWSALNFFDVLARLYPERLEAICNYPVQYFKLKNGAEGMNTWLSNNGKYMVEMDGFKTSTKIVFNHKIL